MLEGMVVGSLGATASVVLAMYGLRLLVAEMPADLTYSVLGITLPSLNWGVTAGVAVLAVLVASGSCSAPVLMAPRPGDLNLRREADNWSFSTAQRVILRTFTAIQVAVAVALMAAAVLLVITLGRLLLKPSGYQPEGLGVLSFRLSGSFSGAASAGVLHEVLQRVRDLEGIVAAEIGPSPATGLLNGQLTIDGRTGGLERLLPVATFPTGPSYLKVAGISLREGRYFTNKDRFESDPVVVVTASTAQRYWPNESALGKKVRIFLDAPAMSIVGVVDDFRTILDTREHSDLLLPAAQAGEPLVIIFRCNPNEFGPTARRLRTAVAAVSPYALVTRVQRVDRLFQQFDTYGTIRFSSLVLGVFALVALVVALAGLASVTSGEISGRLREVALRKALGAAEAEVCQFLLRGVGFPVLAGIAGGMVLAYQALVFASSTFIVLDLDILFSLASVAVIFVAMSAWTAGPMIVRASRISPAICLRGG
jgi:putative ABC transport system permease protein